MDPGLKLWGIMTTTVIVLSDDSPTLVKAAARLAKIVFHDRIQICDGTADDVEINAALVAGAGGKVLLLEGTFNCTANLVIPASTKLEGMGWDMTILNFDDGGAGTVTNAGAITINGTYCSLSDFKLFIAAGCGAAGSRPNGIAFSNQPNQQIEHIWFYGDETVDDANDARQNAIYISNSTYCHIAFCKVENWKRHGINLNGAYTSVFGCMFWSVTRAAVRVLSSSYCVVANNRGAYCMYAVMLVTADQNTVIGNTFDHSGTHGIYVERCDYNTITGNVMAINGGDSIHIMGDGGGNSDYNTVTANICTGNTSDGIEIVGGANANKNIILGNQLLGNTGLPLNDAGANTDIGHNITV